MGSHFMRPSTSLDPFPLPPIFTFRPPPLYLVRVPCAISLKRAAQDFAHGPSGFKSRHQFCTAALMELAFCVTKYSAAECAS